MSVEEEYVDFARQVARRWCRVKYNIRDDLEAVALLAMVKAFKRRVPETHIERKKFLTTCINNAIRDFLIKDKLMPIPRAVIDQHNQYVVLDPERILHQHAKTRAHQEDALRLEELLADYTPLEREVILLRIDKYKQVEIAEKLGISCSEVCKILKRIRSK